MIGYSVATGVSHLIFSLTGRYMAFHLKITTRHTISFSPVVLLYQFRFCSYYYMCSQQQDPCAVLNDRNSSRNVHTNTRFWFEDKISAPHIDDDIGDRHGRTTYSGFAWAKNRKPEIQTRDPVARCNIRWPRRCYE